MTQIPLSCQGKLVLLRFSITCGLMLYFLFRVCQSPYRSKNEKINMFCVVFFIVNFFLGKRKINLKHLNAS